MSYDNVDYPKMRIEQTETGYSVSIDGHRYKVTEFDVLLTLVKEVFETVVVKPAPVDPNPVFPGVNRAYF